MAQIATAVTYHCDCCYLYFDYLCSPKWVCSFYINIHAAPLLLPHILSSSCLSPSLQASVPVEPFEGDRYRLVFPHCATSAISSHRLILQPPLSGVSNSKVCHWGL